MKLKPIVIHNHATETVLRKVPNPKADPAVTNARSLQHLVTTMGLSVARAQELLGIPVKS